MGATSRAKGDQSPELTLPSLSVPHGLHARLQFPLLSLWIDSCIAFSVCQCTSNQSLTFTTDRQIQGLFRDDVTLADLYGFQGSVSPFLNTRARQRVTSCPVFYP